MTTDQANPEPTDVTTELYQAVIGPRSQDYYLLRFSAFDADSKRRVTWHWPAFLSTLNWLVYRRMWGWALGYAAVATAAALAIFGLGKLVFNYSDSTTKVLAALFLLAAFVLPALLANAAYYRFCKTKIAKAVAASADLPQAYERLAKEASTKKRWIVLALMNVGVLALIAVVASRLPKLNPAEKKLPLTTKTAQAPVAAASKAKPAGLPPVAMPAAAPASAPVGAPAVASTPVTATATSSAQAPPAAAAKPEPSDKPQKPGSVGVTANQADRRFFIQVGAFANAANVARAQEKVEAIGLTPFTQPVETPQGRLIRVRLGPFDSKAEANQAAAQIRATGLAALLLRL